MMSSVTKSSGVAGPNVNAGAARARTDKVTTGTGGALSRAGTGDARAVLSIAVSRLPSIYCPRGHDDDDDDDDDDDADD